jgi:colanic acid/amylovoran biosynthesis glycosyltransferase
LSASEPLRIGYVVKRYPRFSETFIVNEILAHERAGIPVHIFAVRRVNEPHFQSILGQVRAPVTYISDNDPNAEGLWSTVKAGAADLPGFWSALDWAQSADVADVQQGIRLARQARALGITHFHAHFATVATTVARLAARFADIGYSFTAHAKDIFHEDVDPAALREKMQDASSIVTVSDYNLDWLRQHHRPAASGVERIYNGLTLSEFHYRSPADRPRKIVAIGRLVEKKGFDVLIDACALLRDRGVVFDCEIIGDGSQFAPLGAKIERLGLTDHVQLSGSLPRSDVITALYSAAVSVMPCIVAGDGDRDGLPTVLIEAMALGTPCVGTDVTGIPEIVCNEKTGLCVPQRDPIALADALARLLDDEALRVRLSQNARALVEAEFDVDRNAAELRTLFARCVDAGDARLRAVG